MHGQVGVVESILETQTEDIGMPKIMGQLASVTEPGTEARALDIHSSIQLFIYMSN